jgi:hypothetical protein
MTTRSVTRAWPTNRKTRLRPVWMRVIGRRQPSIGLTAAGLLLESAMRVHGYFGSMYTLGDDGSRDV